MLVACALRARNSLMIRASLSSTCSGPTAAIAFAVALFFLTGCAQKTPTASQIHAVTSEIVAAAQNATDRKATVTVHTEPRTFHGIPFGAPPVDNIYFSLTDASQDKSLDCPERT